MYHLYNLEIFNFIIFCLLAVYLRLVELWKMTFLYNVCLGYQTAYSQLAFAGKKEHDPLSGEVPDAKLNLAKHLGKLAKGYPGKVSYKQASWIFSILMAVNLRNSLVDFFLCKC